MPASQPAGKSKMPMIIGLVVVVVVLAAAAYYFVM
jgi:hypothetical protein